jgi:hypothetical protein
MVTPTSGRRLTTAAAGKRGKFHEFAMSEQGGCPVTLPCKLFLSSCLCCLLATEVQAQDGQSQAGLHHHPPQDRLLHEKFYSTWHMPNNPSVSCCNDADATQPKSSTSTATSTQNAEKTESTLLFHRKRSSGIETIRMAEITSALPRPMSSTHPIRCSASHWGAPHEIRIGERQDAPPASLLCEVRSPDRSKLPTGNRDAPHLLQSQLLRGPLPERFSTPRQLCKSVMKPSASRRGRRNHRCDLLNEYPIRPSETGPHSNKRTLR